MEYFKKALLRADRKYVSRLDKGLAGIFDESKIKVSLPINTSSQMIYLFAAISTFIMLFGMEGRGSWSKSISIIGGLLWFASVVLAFVQLSWGMGLVVLIGTLILGAVLQRVLRPLLNPHGDQ